MKVFCRPRTMNTVFRNNDLGALARRFLRDDTGATATEYGLIAALIALAIISSVRTVGTNLSTTFGRIGTNLSR